MSLSLEDDDDDDEQLARAIASSLEEESTGFEIQTVLLGSYYQELRCEQEEEDARFSSDLQVIQLLQEAEEEANDAQVREDSGLALDLAAVDALRESEAMECSRIALDAATEAYRERHFEERQQGSWDCPLCTFRNEPYRSHCDACSMKAPKHILTFASMPERLRFGVELELIVPGGLRDGFTCEWVAKQLTSSGIPTTYEGYTHRVVDSWKVVTDASLRTPSNDDLCFELVSPVLVGENGIVSLRTLLESVRKIGIEINTTCGFHVHVDASEGEEQGLAAMTSLGGLQRVSQCFVALENAFDCLVARDSSQQAQQRRANRHRYCQSNVIAFGVLSNKKRWNRISSAESRSELVQLMNPDSDRYRKLNMTNLIKTNRPSTIEFRQHGGVAELLAAEAWVRLILRFCANAANQTLAYSECRLDQKATAVDELRALFRLVDCRGLEAYYLLERKLYSSDIDLGDKGWKCRICKRRFQCSQSLSQHARAARHW